MPSSYFWTWDHSCNWVLDDPGIWTSGCANRYLKRPETFIEDYRQLTDLAAGLGIKGIAIWGFLRDAHGGVEYAKRVADYAASNGVAILPGVGSRGTAGLITKGNTSTTSKPSCGKTRRPGRCPPSLVVTPRCQAWWACARPTRISSTG